MSAAAEAVWTEDEDAVLLARIDVHPFPAISVSNLLGRSVNSVKARLSRLRSEAGLQKKHPTPRGAHYTHRMTNKSVLLVLSCLGCQKPFKSWDAKKNRLCPSCTGKSGDVEHTRHTYKKGM